MADIKDYTIIITSQHRDKPKFMAMAEYLAQTFVDSQNEVLATPAYFDLDDAVGKQLDDIGEWVGLSRQVRIPIAGVYFSFDEEGVGWDLGVWKGEFDPDLGVTSLDDETYRLMIRAKIGANHWDGTLEQYQEILTSVFVGSASQVFGIDYQDMTMDVAIVGEEPSALLKALLTQGYFPLKPAAVRIRGFVFTSVPYAPLFAFDTDPSAEFIAGWDGGAWGIYL